VYLLIKDKYGSFVDSKELPLVDEVLKVIKDKVKENDFTLSEVAKKPETTGHFIDKWLSAEALKVDDKVSYKDEQLIVTVADVKQEIKRRKKNAKKTNNEDGGSL